MAMNTNKLQDNTLESHQFSEVESVQELDSVQDLNLPQERGYEAPLARNYSLAPKFLIGNVSLKSFKSMQSSRSLHPSLRHKQPSLSYLQQKTLLCDEKEKKKTKKKKKKKKKSFSSVITTCQKR